MLKALTLKKDCRNSASCFDVISWPGWSDETFLQKTEALDRKYCSPPSLRLQARKVADKAQARTKCISILFNYNKPYYDYSFIIRSIIFSSAKSNILLEVLVWKGHGIHIHGFWC